MKLNTYHMYLFNALPIKQIVARLYERSGQRNILLCGIHQSKEEKKTKTDKQKWTGLYLTL